MPPPFWIHCNSCVAIFCKKTKFYLLNCKHVSCGQCMQAKSQGGKICPICKDNIKHIELTKLPDQLKNYFKPDVVRLMNEPIKYLNFQQQQQQMLVHGMSSMKRKCVSITQKYEKKKQEIDRLQKSYLKMKELRIKMQQKLKEIWTKQGKFHNSQTYRTHPNATLSSIDSSLPKTVFTSPAGSSIRYPPTANHSKAGSGFFNEDAPMLQSQSRNEKKPIKKPLFA